MGPLGAVGVVGGVGGLGQDVEAGEQAEGLIEVEIADVTASLLIEQLQRQQAQQSTGGGYHRRARIAGLVDDLVEAQASQQGQEQKAPQQNLWVCFGSGSRPRLCNRANFATFAVRKPYDFLVTNFTLLFRPSTAPDETSPLARNQFRISGR